MIFFVYVFLYVQSVEHFVDIGQILLYYYFQMHQNITLEDTQLLERSPKILGGVIMDPSLSFHKHCNYVTDRIDKRNNTVKALAGSFWGQDKETLLLTYNTLRKPIASYDAPIWSTNASDSSFNTIQTLRTATGAHNMASIYHPHQESLTLGSGSTQKCSLRSIL